MPWKTTLPVLEGRRIVLREPRAADAASLFSLLSTEEVARFISPPPPTVEGFARYIAWAQRQRAAGRYVCFAVVCRGSNLLIGLVHVRALGRSFATAEWGVVLASEVWGTGIFAEAAELVLDFAFDVLRTHRLEARAALCNGRGNSAIRKLGAEKEGVLRHAFRRHGDYLDQVLWSILADDWRKRRAEEIVHTRAWVSRVVH